MRIDAAAAFTSLRDAGYERPTPKLKKKGLALAREIFAEAEKRGSPFLYHTPISWSRKWLPSEEFHLVRIPLNAAALPCVHQGENLMLSKIHAREDKPIIVDYNRKQVGGALRGYVPQVIVIDGKHRFQAATLRGESHIMAWVGEQALEIMGMGSGGSGGGPDPASMTKAPGANLVADKVKRFNKLKKRRPDLFSGQQDAALREGARSTYSAEAGHMDEMNVKNVKAGGPGSGRRPGGGAGYWRHSSTEGENRSYHIYEGAGPRGGQWMAKEASNRNPEVKIFDSKKEAQDHVRMSQD